MQLGFKAVTILILQVRNLPFILAIKKVKKFLEGEALADFTEADRESYKLLTKKELPVVPSCELGKMHCLGSLDSIGVPKEKYEEVMKYFIALEFPGAPISCE